MVEGTSRHQRWANTDRPSVAAMREWMVRGVAERKEPRTGRAVGSFRKTVRPKRWGSNIASTADHADTGPTLAPPRLLVNRTVF